jgi:hypothetical protein
MLYHRLFCKRCAKWKSTVLDFGKTEIAQAKAKLSKYDVKEFRFDILCLSCVKVSSNSTAYTSSSKDPRLRRNDNQSNPPQMKQGDKAQFGRLSPAPIAKVESLDGIASSTPQAGTLATAVNVTMAKASVPDAKSSSHAIKKEGWAALSFQPPVNKTAMIDNHEPKMAGPLGQGLKRLATCFDDVYPSIPQGGGLPRAKRMCAADFIELEADKDIFP